MLRRIGRRNHRGMTEYDSHLYYVSHGGPARTAGRAGGREDAHPHDQMISSSNSAMMQFRASGFSGPGAM